MTRTHIRLFSVFSALLTLAGGQSRARTEPLSPHQNCLRTLTYTTPVPLRPNAYNTTIAVPGFDTTRGTLISVQCNVLGELQAHPQVENTDTRPTTITINSTGRISLRRPDFSELTAALPALALSFGAAPYDGVTDFGGSSGKDFGNLSAIQTATSGALTSPADLALFTSGPSVKLPVAGSAISLITSDGNRNARITAQTGGTVEVVYTYASCVAISGTIIYETHTRDGAAQADEPGVAGATVTATGDTDGDGDIETISTTTDASGNYRFEHIFTGSYVISAQAPSGYTFTPDTPTQYQVAATTPDQEYRPFDFFLYTAVGSIGDYIWYDLNKDGIPDADEPGIAGVVVSLINAGQDGLLDTADDIVTKQVTGFDGSYLFTKLSAGAYRVSIDAATLPADYLPTFDADGINSAHRFDYYLRPGEDKLDVNFGYRQEIASAGATREAGFWKTHLKATQKAADRLCIDLGLLKFGPALHGEQDLSAASLGQIMALFWSNESHQGSDCRSKLGRTRLHLAEELIAGMANAFLLGTTTAQNNFSPTLLAEARAALAGSDITLMKRLTEQLEAFNDSGEDLPLTPMQAQAVRGAASPKEAKALADRDSSGTINPGPAFR